MGELDLDKIERMFLDDNRYLADKINRPGINSNKRVSCQKRYGSICCNTVANIVPATDQHISAEGKA